MPPIVIEVPEKHKHLADAFARALALLEDGDAEAASGAAVDFAAVEEASAEASAAVERAIAHARLAKLDIDRPAVTVDGERYHRVGRYPATYYTLAGPVVVERTLYRRVGERNAKTVDAVSLRSGTVGKGWLPRTAKAMARQVQATTSREAEANQRETGRLAYSRTSFEEVAHLVGAEYVAHRLDIEEELIQEAVLPDEVRSVAVSLDRVSLPMEEPRPRPRGRPRKGAARRPISRVFRMAYAGCVTFCDGAGEAVHTLRYGAMPQGDAAQLCAGMAGDVAALVAKRPDLAVVALCDGAPEMWNLVESALDESAVGVTPTRLVDLWHVVEKLGKAAAILGGGGALVERWKLALLNRDGAAARILDELRASGKEWARLGDEHPVHDAITYLDNHAERMGYAAARRRGLPVGSGNVEATCKSLVEVRMKRPGARWKHQTGEELMQLRALALSDRWQAAVPMALAHSRHEVKAAA